MTRKAKKTLKTFLRNSKSNSIRSRVTKDRDRLGDEVLGDRFDPSLSVMSATLTLAHCRMYTGTIIQAHAGLKRPLPPA